MKELGSFATRKVWLEFVCYKKGLTKFLFSLSLSLICGRVFNRLGASRRVRIPRGEHFSGRTTCLWRRIHWRWKRAWECSSRLQVKCKSFYRIQNWKFSERNFFQDAWLPGRHLHDRVSVWKSSGRLHHGRRSLCWDRKRYQVVDDMIDQHKEYLLMVN